jgi:hypothetical protein
MPIAIDRFTWTAGGMVLDPIGDYVVYDDHLLVIDDLTTTSDAEKVVIRGEATFWAARFKKMIHANRRK